MIDVGTGSVKIALFASRESTIVPGSGVARIDLNRLAEVIDRRIKFAQIVADDSAIDVSLGVCLRGKSLDVAEVFCFGAKGAIYERRSAQLHSLLSLSQSSPE